MKLATYKDGSRDGQLVVVARDLSTAHYATGLAHTLQQALDDWNFIAPQLQDLYVTLNQGKARHAFAFDPRMCLAPLPRSSTWWWARAEVGCAARGAPLHGPTHDLPWPTAVAGVEAAAGLAVITGDMAQGVSADQALESVRLLTLAHVVGAPLSAAAGPVALAAAFGPLAVTPDELGSAWAHGRLQLALRCQIDGREPEVTDAAAVPWQVGEALASACRHAGWRAGGIAGFALRATVAQAPQPEAAVPVRLEVRGRDGGSVFGVLAHALGAEN